MKDAGLMNFIEKHTQDPFKNTVLEGYTHLTPKTKGMFGEQFVSAMLTKNGNKIGAAKTSTSGYDRIVDGRKLEIKFSVMKKQKFIINHVSLNKDWDILLFCGISLTTQNEIEYTIVYFTKKDFEEKLQKLYFKHQQGGNSIKNDDFMCSGINRTNLFKDPLVKRLLPEQKLPVDEDDINEIILKAQKCKI
jgi:hypothetical protein